MATVGLLVDALTGLERILTTPIPFSYVNLRSQTALYADGLTRYSVHLWTVTLVYCFFLASQYNIYILPVFY
jgi:putative membrane protein